MQELFILAPGLGSIEWLRGRAGYFLGADGAGGRTCGSRRRIICCCRYQERSGRVSMASEKIFKLLMFNWPSMSPLSFLQQAQLSQEAGADPSLFPPKISR